MSPDINFMFSWWRSTSIWKGCQ